MSGTTYYVAWSAAVPGYIGNGSYKYTFDRWGFLAVTVCAVMKNAGYVSVSVTSGNNFSQRIPAYRIQTGNTYTLSILTDTKLYSASFTAASGETQIMPAGTIVDGVRSTIVKYDSCWELRLLAGTSSGIHSANLIAAKLERGGRQTLAHQDADGSWVLNDPPPDRALELAKCQRYFLRIGRLRAKNLPSQALIPVMFPVSMRIVPTVKTESNTGAFRILADSSNMYALIEQVTSGDGTALNIDFDANL